MMYLTADQYKVLMNPLHPSRVEKRSQGGKQLSYLAAYDVKAHLTRVFGFGNWDAEVTREQFMGLHPYAGKEGKEMVEVMWQATVRLTVNTYPPLSDQWTSGPIHQTVYEEGAVGSATGSATSSGLGDLHDNALKTAASDALKRCAINLGTAFGLSLYNNGSTQEIIKKVLVGVPEPVDPTEQDAVQMARAATLAGTIGATSEEEATELLASQLGAQEVSS